MSATVSTLTHTAAARETQVRRLAPQFFGELFDFNTFQEENALEAVNSTLTFGSRRAEMIGRDVFYVIDLDSTGTVSQEVVDELAAHHKRRSQMVRETVWEDWSDEDKNIVVPLRADQVPGVQIITSNEVFSSKFETWDQFLRRTGRNPEEVILA